MARILPNLMHNLQDISSWLSFFPFNFKSSFPLDRSLFLLYPAEYDKASYSRSRNRGKEYQVKLINCSNYNEQLNWENNNNNPLIIKRIYLRSQSIEFTLALQLVMTESMHHSNGANLFFLHKFGRVCFNFSLS